MPDSFVSVGENTFPNAVPFTSGYSEEDLKKVCYFTPETPQDACPYIWKRFSSANYLTALLEDFPHLSIFNYQKTGFMQQPVDFYLRPLMQFMYDDKIFTNSEDVGEFFKHLP